MAGLIHKIRIRTYPWRTQLSAAMLRSIVSQINDRAQSRRMIGQIAGAGLRDGKTRLNSASHIVMPTARLQGSSIIVEIEIVEETSPGRTVAAFIGSKLPISGVLRAIGSLPDDLHVVSVDIDLSNTRPEETILDDIVDALESPEV